MSDRIRVQCVRTYEISAEDARNPAKAERLQQKYQGELLREGWSAVAAHAPVQTAEGWIIEAEGYREVNDAAGAGSALPGEGEQGRQPDAASLPGEQGGGNEEVAPEEAPQ